jgi:type I restriction enzyme, S subunit
VGSFIFDGVKCTVIPNLKFQAIAKADCFCVRTLLHLVENTFLAIAISAPSLYSQLAIFMHGMTRQRINTTQLREMLIPFPYLFEQQVIAERVVKLLSMVDALEGQIVECKEISEKLKQSVLREAFAENN